MARYRQVAKDKATGKTYTPWQLASFVADRMLSAAAPLPNRTIRVLDPASGNGVLLQALMSRLEHPVEIFAFDTDSAALKETAARLSKDAAGAALSLHHRSFLDHVLDCFDGTDEYSETPYDLIIANPPYVRTQILGKNYSRRLSAQFGLRGRVDLYHAFLLAMSRVLSPGGTGGFIVSNRILTTKGGAELRQALANCLRLREVYDLGDTRLFDASVLPSVIIASGADAKSVTASFHSIYETRGDTSVRAAHPLCALKLEGRVEMPDGRIFSVQHGKLDHSCGPNGIWRITSNSIERWRRTIQDHTWGSFSDIGKIRVGVKTCADSVFLPRDWMDDYELHRPLTTHHAARRYRAMQSRRMILYPHFSHNGKARAADLSQYPKSRHYLEAHRKRLESRTYLINAGRNWYEIWVPQNPDDWPKPKIVFRDISEKPTFWMDLAGTVVNGDCYWLSGDEDLLWLALGVANSSFIERYYDQMFNSRLYAGRRRYMAQYVEQFPLPDPKRDVSKRIIKCSRQRHEDLAVNSTSALENHIDQLVWNSFGLGAKAR